MSAWTSALSDGVARADPRLAFDYAVEPMLLLDPRPTDRRRQPAACTLLGYDRALLRQIKISALHAGQLPALIVFTQAVLDKGACWTTALTPRHATGSSCGWNIPARCCRMTAARWCC